MPDRDSDRNPNLRKITIYQANGEPKVFLEPRRGWPRLLFDITSAGAFLFGNIGAGAGIICGSLIEKAKPKGRERISPF